jgi:adenylate kinase
MTIKIRDKEFKPYLSSEQIHDSVKNIADKINKELEGEDVIFMGILNGAFMFASDLFKLINIEARITFLKLASYEGTVSSGKVKRLIGINEDIKDKTVVVLEDIIDTGITMENIIKQLRGYEPKEIKVATLLFKPEAFQKDYKIDYIGFTIPNDFIIGYGLDYDGYGRNYPDIYSVVKTNNSGSKMKNILIFGPPGAGKGTQSKKIIHEFNLVHLSTGDILRAEILSNTSLGQEAKKFIDKGELVPDQVVIDMIDKKIESNINGNGFVFDGFPRTFEQAEALCNLLKKYNTEISVMISLDVNSDELTKRLLKRAKEEGRVDDTPKIIAHRIEVYNEKTAQVAEFYSKQNKLQLIPGVGEIDNIFKLIKIELDKL